MDKYKDKLDYEFMIIEECLVEQINLNKEFESSYQAAEYLNEHYFNNTKTVKHIAAKIRSCCLGTQKSAYGFTWENK